MSIRACRDGFMACALGIGLGGMRILALAITLLAATPSHASCSQMRALAQEHANDMARRGSMDHAGFHSRAMRGARAENVAA